MNLDNKYPQVVKAIEQFRENLWGIKYAGDPEITIETEAYQHIKDSVLPMTHIGLSIIIKFRVYHRGEYHEGED